MRDDYRPLRTKRERGELNRTANVLKCECDLNADFWEKEFASRSHKPVFEDVAFLPATKSTPQEKASTNKARNVRTMELKARIYSKIF